MKYLTLSEMKQISGGTILFPIAIGMELAKKMMNKMFN